MTLTAVGSVEPARCRCSHVRSQHYVDRKGRPQCVYPCGCTEFRPRDTDQRPSTGLRDDFAAAWTSATTVAGGIALGIGVLAFLGLTHRLGELLYAASTGGHR